MRNGWMQLLNIVPQRYRAAVDTLGRDSLQELRLRMGAPPELVLPSGSRWLDGGVARDEIQWVISAASRYSPWAAATVSKGYITARGGHRIGICGEAVCKNGIVEGIRNPDSLCIRVARDLLGIVENAAQIHGSVLIIGAPGWGKTTLLRDLCRRISDLETTAVVDERGELFPVGFCRGKRMDVLQLCPKVQGIDMALRTMGPECIAVDEITEKEDCLGLIRAANCGVRLLATAHAVSREDLMRRSVYRPLLEQRIFEALLVLRKDKSFTVERMES